MYVVKLLLGNILSVCVYQIIITDLKQITLLHIYIIKLNICGIVKKRSVSTAWSFCVHNDYDHITMDSTQSIDLITRVVGSWLLQCGWFLQVTADLKITEQNGMV